MKQAKIVEIPASMTKYYGTGSMLHPDLDMVVQTLKMIPSGKVTNIRLLTQKMAIDYSADVACPMRTGNHLKQLSKKKNESQDSSEVPFWRVLRNNNTLVKLTDIDFWAALLEKEGMQLAYTNQGLIRVLVNEKQWYRF